MIANLRVNCVTELIVFFVMPKATKLMLVYMIHIFDSEVSLHSWLLRPTVRYKVGEQVKRQANHILVFLLSTAAIIKVLRLCCFKVLTLLSVAEASLGL